LFVDRPLSEGQAVALDRAQTHYLADVMRARPGEIVLLFNGQDGEWRARIDALAKAGAALVPVARTREQAAESDLWLLAAPLKRDCADLVAEKATELGVARLWPVFTRRTQSGRINAERLRARTIEAAEQCERLSLPTLGEAMALDRALGDWPTERTLILLDEAGEAPPLADLAHAWTGGPAALLVGPEGGFDPDERAWLRRFDFVRPATLGPRILRAETAAIAALAIWQALAGDGRRPPRDGG
jgi:16S rRNA (uracil1498-N3)-methyltransferase